MGWRLNTYVHAVELDSAGKPTGRSGGFGPDDQVPDWAIVSITNPDVWASEGSRDRLPARPEAQHQGAGTPAMASPAADQENEHLLARIAELEGRIAELESARAADPQVQTVEVPPMGGPGSSAAEWRSYAATQGVDVAVDASRDEVVAALETAGKPTK